jgi:hypothetical protein
VEGGGRCRDSFKDVRPFRLIEHGNRRKAQHGDALQPQPGVPMPVMQGTRLMIVAAAIDLNSQPRRRAKEIRLF